MPALRTFPMMALGLAALPLVGLVMAGRLPGAIARHMTSKRNTLFTDDYLLKHLVVEDITPQAREAAVDALQDRAKALAEAQDWTAIAAWIEELDQSRPAFTDGERHLNVVLDQLRWTICEFYEAPLYCNEEYAFGIPVAVMATLKATLDGDPDNYALAAFLGRLHLDCGWAARGSDAANTVAAGEWATMNEHYAEARNLVTRFDPVAYNSPFLAEVQYLLNIGLENGADRLQDTIDDWVDLDPTDPRAYRRHAFHCLDRWFGDAEFLASEADRLATRLDVEMGDAAYFLVISHGLTHQEDIAHHVDVPRYLNGLDTLLDRTGSDPLTTLRLFYDANRGAVPEGAFSGLFPNKDDKAMQEIKAGLAPLMRKHVRAYCQRAWPTGVRSFLKALAPAYQNELEVGAIVSVTPDGVTVSDPSA